jgi:hypothetical protein
MTMQIDYKEATFRIHQNGLIERLNKKTDQWFVAPILKDKYGDAVTRVDFKYVKIYRLMSVYFGLKVNDKLAEITHKNNNKMDNSLDNLMWLKK